MADRHGCIVLGFTVTPTQRKAGDVIGVPVFALHCSYNQVVQHIGDRPGGKCLNQLTVDKRPPQAIAAEQQYIARLQLYGFTALHIEHVIDTAKTMGDMVTLRMDARFFGSNLSRFDPLLHR